MIHWVITIARVLTPGLVDLGSGLIIRKWQNGRRGRSHRSGLQPAASPSVRKRDSRFCDACDPASCCNGLVSCGNDGAGCKAGCPAGPASYGFCCCHTLDPRSPLLQAAVLEHPISTSEVEVTALAPSRRWSCGDHLCCHRPHGACWSSPPWCHQSGGGHPPLLKLDAVGWALRSVVSIVRTSGSAASDADDSEKIRSNHIMGSDPREHLDPPSKGTSEQVSLGL